MHTRSIALGAALLAIVASCETPFIMRANKDHPPPPSLRPRPAADVLLVSAYPRSGYVEIGRLATADDTLALDEDKIAAMRKRAGEAGCEVLVVRGDGKVERRGWQPPLSQREGACLIRADVEAP